MLLLVQHTLLIVYISAVDKLQFMNDRGVKLVSGGNIHKKSRVVHRVKAQRGKRMRKIWTRDSRSKSSGGRLLRPVMQSHATSSVKDCR